MQQFKFYWQLFFITVLLLTAACGEQKMQDGKPAQVTEPVHTQQKSKILYITSVGWFHDYQKQIQTITRNISGYVDADIDVIVGDTEYLKVNDFSAGYDLLIYNFCHAAQRDEELVQSLITPVTEKGLPLVALHCTMHSFQFDERWPSFLGLHTLRHEEQRAITVKKMGKHPLISEFPERWDLASDELYITLSQNDSIMPLLQSYGIETEKNHTQAWLYQSGKGKVIGTTLGHSDSTLDDLNFQRFLGNSIQYLLGLELTAAPRSVHTSSVTLLSADLAYPDKQEKQCVIHNMFAIGGEKVKNCVTKLCMDSLTLDECTSQCQKDNPWPVPEDLREACQNNELSVPN
jgi:type 1 glutamine amidotransferase